MNKPLINQESQFWSSFVEDKGEIHQLEQENKGKAPLTKKTNFGSMNNKRGDIELAWSYWYVDKKGNKFV